MQMRSDVQIKSAIKALTDVVLPAVDPHNKLAQEQLQLTVGLLSLMATQLPLQFRFDCDELTRLIGFAGQLGEAANGGAETTAAATSLTEVLAEAQRTLEGVKSSPSDVVQCNRALRSATGALVTQTYVDGDSGCRDAVRKTVLAHSKEQLLRDRSWLLMQGWEPDPKAIPPIAELLGDASTSSKD